MHPVVGDQLGTTRYRALVNDLHVYDVTRWLNTVPAVKRSD